MFTALRSVTAKTPPPNLLHHRLPSRKASDVRFRRVFSASAAGCPDNNMQKANDDANKSTTPPSGTQSKVGDTMSSFGEGYATRSEEEGFGGIYGGNIDEDEKITQDAPEYDHTQGSEVKEKEKARHQPHSA